MIKIELRHLVQATNFTRETNRKKYLISLKKLNLKKRKRKVTVATFKRLNCELSNVHVLSTPAISPVTM